MTWGVSPANHLLFLLFLYLLCVYDRGVYTRMCAHARAHAPRTFRGMLANLGEGVSPAYFLFVFSLLDSDGGGFWLSPEPVTGGL